MDKRIRLLNAWVERWKLSNEEVSIRLSKYRRITVEQVVRMRNGTLIPSNDTFNAWAVEINSSPEVNTFVGTFFEDVFKGFKK